MHLLLQNGQDLIAIVFHDHDYALGHRNPTEDTRLRDVAAVPCTQFGTWTCQKVLQLDKMDTSNCAAPNYCLANVRSKICGKHEGMVE